MTAKSVLYNEVPDGSLLRTSVGGRDAFAKGLQKPGDGLSDSGRGGPQKNAVQQKIPPPLGVPTASREITATISMAKLNAQVRHYSSN